MSWFSWFSAKFNQTYDVPTDKINHRHINIRKWYILPEKPRLPMKKDLSSVNNVLRLKVHIL